MEQPCGRSMSDPPGRDRSADRSADQGADRWAVGGLAAIVIASVALRVAAARGDLWFDEIRSLYLARSADSTLGVFNVGHDNNHLLNSMWVRLLRFDASPILFRLPSIAAGGVATALAGLWGWRRSRWTAFAAAALFGFGLLGVQYGSEARGYGVALAAVVAMVLTLESLLVERRPPSGESAPTSRRWWLSALGFHVAVIVGVLAHLLMIPIYAALLRWWAGAQPVGGWRPERWPRHVAVHGVPIAFLGWLYLRFIRNLGIGGGPSTEAMRVAGDAAAIALGLPLGEIASWGALGLALAAVVGGCWALASRGDRRWILFALGCVVLPAALLAVRRPSYVGLGTSCSTRRSCGCW